LDVISDFDCLSKALRDKYSDTTENEEARRQAKDSLHGLRQKPYLELSNYIKQVKKFAQHIPPEDEHYVTTKLVKGIYDKGLRVHATSGFPFGTSLDKTISTVKRLSNALGTETSAEQGYSDLDDVDPDEPNASNSGDEEADRRRSREWKLAQSQVKQTRPRERPKPSKKTDTSEVLRVERTLREEREELKPLFLNERAQLVIPNPPVAIVPSSLLLVDAFAVTNPLAPPQTRTPISRPTRPRFRRGLKASIIRVSANRGSASRASPSKGLANLRMASKGSTIPNPMSHPRQTSGNNHSSREVIIKAT
jgi:hypothetical protein